MIKFFAIGILVIFVCTGCLQFDTTKLTLNFDSKGGVSGKLKREYINLSSSAKIPENIKEAAKLEDAKLKYEKQLNTDYNDLIDKWKNDKFIDETLKDLSIAIEKRNVYLKNDNINGEYEGKFDAKALEKMNFFFIENQRACILPKSAGVLDDTDGKIISTGSYYLVLWPKDKKSIYFIQSPMKTKNNRNLLSRWQKSNKK
ncbi:MAG: hypothetical protein JXA60_06545 [Candidatus Coatesbacteria bacterium]|nr:hypothetical protein [Candidatus Coatesbacteria bacterium]